MKKLVSILIILSTSIITWGQGDVEFTYTYENDKVDSNSLDVHATITNTTDSPIYFLSNSCYGLRAYINTTVPTVWARQLRFCLAVMPKIVEIKAQSEYNFDIDLGMKGTEKEFSLILTFVQVEADEIEREILKSDGLEIFVKESTIQNNNVDRTLYLEGPIIAVNY